MKSLGVLVRIVLLAVLASSGMNFAAAQTQPSAAPPVKVALVIGNSSYEGVSSLANPVNDARAIAEKLNQLGFKTDVLYDGDRAAMMAAVRRLSDAAQGAEAAVLFYAGHAVEIGGRNLLLSVAATARRVSDLEREAVGYEEVAALLEGRARTTLIFLDACRDSPIGPQVAADSTRTGGRSQRGESRGLTRSVGSGLANVASHSGTLVAFATAPGRVALDGSSNHSPFTTGLLKHLSTPGLEVRQMLGRVRQDVREATGGAQIPWDNSSLEVPFLFLKENLQGTLTPVSMRPGLSLRGTLERSFAVRANAGQVRRVRHYSNFNTTTCRTLGAPEVVVLSAPKNGTLSSTQEEAEVGFAITPDSSCIGKYMPSTVIFYTPAPGFRGDDSFTLAPLSRGLPWAQDTYRIEIR